MASPVSSSHYKYFLSTVVALIAFAGNSVLCRLALGNNSIDASSFTIARLVSGAIVLFCLVRFITWYRSRFTSQVNIDHTNIAARSTASKFLSAFMLFVYAVGFSYAYIALDTGVGALILFGCVQLTMVFLSIYKKQALAWQQYLGVLLAFVGLVYLLQSQQSLAISEFSLFGFILMAVAGVAWAFYTVLGKTSTSPLLDTTSNFIYAIPFCVLLIGIYFFVPYELNSIGFTLAIMSGGLTSALGYAIWYYALDGLSSISAGVVQLLVPVIAALGGAIWANETITASLIISQFVILGGISLVVLTKTK